MVAFVLFMEGLLAVAALIIIIYLIFKRIEEKKEENFEDRDY